MLVEGENVGITHAAAHLCRMTQARMTAYVVGSRSVAPRMDGLARAGMLAWLGIPLTLEASQPLALCNGFEGALLVLVAMLTAWIVAPTLLLGVAITMHWSLRPAVCSSRRTLPRNF